MIETYTNTDATYGFSLKAKSGQTLLNSIGYSDKNQMDLAIKNLREIKIGRNNFDRKTNNEGRFLFNLKDSSGNLIGSSQLYDSEAGMENGIKNLQNRLEALTESDGL